MKSFVKRRLRKIAKEIFKPAVEDIISGQVNRSQETQILLAQHYKDLVRRNVRPLPTFDEVGFRCHSQFEEDGILLYILSLIGTTNKISVEMCASRGLRCNTTNLISNHGWQGYLFDGDPKKVEKGKQFFSRHKDVGLWRPRFIHAWITAENVNEILETAGVSGEIDLFSLDIDGMDYWIWKALDCIEPRVVVCEVHCGIGPDRSLTVPYDPNFVIEIPGYHGASLPAMVKLASQKGYRLVGASRHGLNAFFVRNGIGEDLLPPASISDCLKHPRCQYAMEHGWPKIENLPWVEV